MSSDESVSEPTRASRVVKKTCVPPSSAAAAYESNGPLPPAGPVEISVVTVPARRYTSRESSVSAALSRSSVWKTTDCPASTAAPKLTGKAPLPPIGPVETSVVAPPVRSYTSNDESVSELTSGSAVRMYDRFQSLGPPTSSALWPPLPPSGPIDSSDSFVCCA